MKITFTTEPIKYPLTDTGRYSLELVKRLAITRGIEESKLFHNASFIDQIPQVENKSDTKTSSHGRPSAFLHHQLLLIEAYRLLYPRRQVWVLRDYEDYIHHGPSFYLSHRLERAVTALHDIPTFTCPEYYPKDRVCYTEKLLCESLGSARLILAASGFSRSEVIRLFNYPADRIITIKLTCSSGHIPCNPAECLPVLQKYQLAWQGYTLYIGTIEPRRNIRGLLQAYQLLPMETHMRYPLILSGYRGWKDDVLWQLVEHGTRGGWIRYLDYVPDEDLPHLYVAARTFVYPSFYGGFGLPILEAMSCGMPVVCSSITSLPGAVGNAGPVTDPNDVDAISAHILQSLQDGSWREVTTAHDLAQAKQFLRGNCMAQAINTYELPQGYQLRVLHVYKTCYPNIYGGIEQVIYQLGQGYACRGIVADIFAFSPDKGTGPAAYEDHRVIYNKQLSETASMPLSLKALKRFKQIEDDYDTINYHFSFPLMDILHLSVQPDTRTVVTYHSDTVKQRQLMKLHQPLRERFLASVDCIVALSPNHVASSQTLKKYQDKTVVIPSGLEQHDMQHDLRRVTHRRETVGDNFSLFVGVFRYYKRLHILSDATERSRLSVMIVRGGPLEVEVHREAQQRGLSSVVFTGMLGDEGKYILFQLCRDIVLPSHLRFEMFGIMLLEDAHFARPLISCRIGTGTSFINQDKANGCAAPPDDSQAPVEAMNELWHSDETASRYGENSCRRFEKMFTADRVIGAYVDLYTTLLESKP